MTEEIKDETYFRLKEEYLSKLQRLKQENEELKKKIQILNKDSYTRLREMSVLDTELDEVGVINNNYRTALEEIRELILQECKRCGKNITEYCERCWVNDTLNKINEVLK